jgi:CheY-like chemotaxis protein
VETLPGRELRLSWTERGGPKVSPPATTGFGTTLITQIANRQLSGMIDVAWLPEGLRLVATLPPSTYDQALAPPPATAPSAWISPSLADGGPATSGKVLVVEDELLISLELCDGLRVLGWEIVGPAPTVADALRLIEITPNIDVAILDINLGGELVYPVAERLRVLGVPFVYCTGYEQPSLEGRRVEDTTIRKPVNMRLLTQQLHTLKRAA